MEIMKSGEGGKSTSLTACPRMRAPDAVMCGEKEGGFIEEGGREGGGVGVRCEEWVWGWGCH